MPRHAELFRVVGHFVVRAFRKTSPRLAAQLFGIKAHRNNPAAKRGKRKHQRQSVSPSTLYVFPWLCRLTTSSITSKSIDALLETTLFSVIPATA